MELPLQRPAPSIMPDSWGQGQSVPRGIGDVDPPPQAMPSGRHRSLLPLHAGDGIADVELGARRTISAPSTTAHVAGHSRLVPLPRGRQQPRDRVSFQHARSRRLQGGCVPQLALAAPWRRRQRPPRLFRSGQTLLQGAW
jgi:hypothetical protein